MSAPTDIVDESGQSFRLGDQLGKGGEGGVWEIPAMPSMAAKVYHEPLDADRAEKIRAMSKIGTPALAKLTAWPDRLLLRKSGAPIGLLIPKVAASKDIHQLYTPKSRLIEFQRADWRFLVHVAANTARSFAAVHDAGHVIGDVNFGSVLVAQDATVRLVDTDSFQITIGGKRYSCDKGVDLFTPPELQKKHLAGMLRKPNHDAFGLAILIFNLLFLGRHPFAGVYKNATADMQIQQAIREVRFPYGARAASVEMKQPPNTPPLSIVGREVGLLFERAFASESLDNGRPTAREWMGALDQLEKKSRQQCTVQKSHFYPVHLGYCPWCAIEKNTGAPLFPFVFHPTVASPGVDIQTLFKRVETLHLPLEPPPAATGIVSASPAAAALVAPSPPPLPGAVNSGAWAIAFIVAAIGLFIAFPPAVVLIFPGCMAAYAFMVGHMEKKRKAEVQVLMEPYQTIVADMELVVGKYETAMKNARTQLDHAVSEWTRNATVPDFQHRKEKVRKLKFDLDKIPEKRRSELNKLESRRQAIQLSRHLSRIRVIDASIPGFGPERKATLESFGIETADDVTASALSGVPGFGPVLTNKLLDWRKKAERHFVFNPTQAIDPAAIAAVEQTIVSERMRLEVDGRREASRLLQDVQIVIETRKQLSPKISSLQQIAAQARADHEHASAALRSAKATPGS